MVIEIWHCAYCGEEFPLDEDSDTGHVCPSCESDDTGFHYEKEIKGVIKFPRK